MPDKLRGTAGLSATTAIIVTAERIVFNPYTIAFTLAEVPIAIVGTTRGTHLDTVESESIAPLKNIFGTYSAPIGEQPLIWLT